MNLKAIARRFNAARDRRKACKPIPLRPDPEYRDRRLAQFTPERRARYWRNVAAINAGAV
jgi:hypothetical protein